MLSAVVSLLQCPTCAAGALMLREDGLHCAEGHAFVIDDGVPRLVDPPDLTYRFEDAETYDELMTFVATLLQSDEVAARRRAIDALELRPGDRVLEVGCGPGNNFPHLFERLGRRGEVFAGDISPSMIRVARRRRVIAPEQRHLFLLNGSRLPFADATFDAVLQIGTINRFPDIAAALAEMVRVTKHGGMIVVSDEGIGPWLEKTDYGALLKKFGGFFEGEVPLHALPPEAQDVRLWWDLGHAFYAIAFRVGNPPAANLDVKLPGRDATVREVLEKGKGTP
jgi:SAM-dependent methyltransferase